MAPNSLIFYNILFIQVLTTVCQSTVKQYLHVAGVGPHSHSAGLANLPTVGLTRQAVPASLAAVPSGLASFPSSGLAIPTAGLGGGNTGLVALSTLASIPGLLQALTSSAAPTQPVAVPTGVPTLKAQPSSQTPSVPTSKQNSLATNTPDGGLDSGVLNNLAIALQLLIVSNILNSNLPENEANPIYEMLETVKNIPTSLSQSQSGISPSSSLAKSYSEPTYSQVQCYSDPSFTQIQNYGESSFLPNSNFVGSSGFTEASISDPFIKPMARNSYQLMSPYEALGPCSPFSDPILASPYGSIISSKKDFQSPYAMLDSEPFSMSDLF